MTAPFSRYIDGLAQTYPNKAPRGGRRYGIMAIIMAIKMTFSLDDETATRLQRTAEALRKPKSEVVREAIHDYSERLGKLGEAERRSLLQAFDRLVPAIPQRPVSEVEQELEELRRARRSGGRRSGQG